MYGDFEVTVSTPKGEFVVVMKDEADRYEAMRRAADRIEREHGIHHAKIIVTGCKAVG
jgi:hypothetical protein